MKKYLFIILTFILSCQRNETKINSEEDLKSAKELTINFYKDLSVLDSLKIIKYLDSSIPKNQFNKLIKNNYSEYGSVKRVDIKDIVSKNLILNGVSEINYKIQVFVVYDKANCNEEISFIKKENQNTKIDGYLIQKIIE